MRLLPSIAILATAVVSADAAVLVSDPFSYANGNLAGNVAPNGNTWTAFNTGTAVAVTAGRATFAGGAGQEAYVAVTTQTSGTVFLGLDVSVTSIASMTTTGGYFAGALEAGSTSAFGATIWVRRDATDATKFNFGVSNRSNSPVSWDSVQRTVGTDYRLVSAYTIVSGSANDSSALYIDPASSAASPTLTATGGTDFSTSGVGRFFFRQDATTSTPAMSFDNLTVANDFASAVPEPASLGVLGLLGLAMGRRRR